MTSTQLHPLCIINMSDHYTRLSLNSADGASAPTYGILYGSPPTPTTTELLDSDDLPFTSNGSVITIDTAKLDLVKSLHTEVFPTHSVQGLYKVGPAPTPHDMSLLSSLQLNTPTPLLFVRLNPTISADELPIEVYTVASPAGNNVFLLADFTIETEEAEAVAITNVVKQVSGEQQHPVCTMSVESTDNDKHKQSTHKDHASASSKQHAAQCGARQRPALCVDSRSLERQLL